jgi:CoA binding domain
MEANEPDDYSDAFLRDILSTVKTIAMVGASDKETRPSHVVFAYLLARGYQVIGVNPGLAGKSVHGAAFFKTLADVPEPPGESSMRRLRSSQNRRSFGCSSASATMQWLSIVRVFGTGSGLK